MFKLAIVGRPNVGKSALFNKICKKRISIVDQQEGITRDRLYAKAELFGSPFEVIDTGGIDNSSSVLFKEAISLQARIAIAEADTLIMVVDAQIGITKADHALAQELRRMAKPLTLAINKIDDPIHEPLLHAFHALGIAKMISISALHGHRIAELLETALKGFVLPPIKETDSVNVSVVGRTNVGKSTLVNTLLTKERCLVSPIRGTTLDSIDIPFSYNQRDYLLVDTAGVRRKKSEHTTAEKFAAIRTQRTIERSHICLLILDANEGMSAQDKRIAKHIEKEGKGCVLLMNKWDLVEGYQMEHCGFNLCYCCGTIESTKEGKRESSIFNKHWRSEYDPFTNLEIRSGAYCSATFRSNVRTCPTRCGASFLLTFRSIRCPLRGSSTLRRLLYVASNCLTPDVPSGFCSGDNLLTRGPGTFSSLGRSLRELSGL